MAAPALPAGPANTFVRGDQVRHRSTEIIGASRGTVVGVLTDFDRRPFAVVQWQGGSMTCTYLYLLERTSFPKPQA